MNRIFTLAILLFSFSFIYGQAGRLNPNFNGGTVRTTFDPSGAQAEDLIVQPDGKVVAAGLAYSGGIAHFALARYLSNGALDADFGINGKVTTLIHSGSWAHSIALQKDGKIVVAGYAETGSSQDFALARYLSNGSLDASFGMGGIVTTDFANYSDEIYDIAIQADGKIVAGGRTFNGYDYDFALVRYNINGSIDPSFGGGKVVSGVGPGNDFAQSVQVQHDGKILLAGTAFNGTNNNMAVIRITAQGTLDATFGSDGKVITAVGETESFGFDIALQNDEKILFTGHTYNVLPYRIDVALVRYTTSGQLDPTFGVNGQMITDVANTNDDGIGVAVQNDGKIIVAGHTTSEGYKDFLLLRYLPNGILDHSFGTDGIATTPVGIYDDIAYSVKLSGLNIYIAGISNNSPSGVPGTFALASFINDATPLPVKMLDFTAQKDGTAVLLQWQTENEDQLIGYRVEKSGDGQNFQTIQQVAAQNSRSGTKHYVAKDPIPFSPISYYRLQLLDRSGSFSYSKVIALRNNETQLLHVFPNPATSMIQVQLPSGLSGLLTIELVDVSGRTFQINSLEMKGNAVSTPVDLTRFASGVYQLKVSTRQQNFSQKIVKQ